MADIIQLRRQDGLATLFDDSVRASAPTALSPELSAKAIRLHRAGADAASIGGQLGVSLAQVLPVLDRHRKAQQRQEEARKRQAATSSSAPRNELGQLASVSPDLDGPATSKGRAIDEAAAEACEGEDPAADLPESDYATPIEVDDAFAPPPPAAAQIASRAPDVEFSPLQRRAIRYARAKLGVSLETLARAARTNLDHIRRICEEGTP
jgi:hypothetical protein